VEIEPSLLPIRVVGCHHARQVQLLARIPQCERQAADVNRLTCLRLARGEGVEFCAEEVNLEIPIEGPIRRIREGGSEWEPIKILLEGDGDSNKMNTASNTRLRLTTQVSQDHTATGVLLTLGTNNQPH
jgi:hypothetical protein